MDRERSVVNDRVLLHSIALGRARSVVGFCDLLRYRVVSDEEREAYAFAAAVGRELVDLLKSLACDADEARQGVLF